MPYPRRSYRRRYVRRPYRRYRKSTKSGWTWSNAAAMAASALKGVNYIKGLVNSEVYKLDTNNSFFPTTSGAVTNLFALAQGDGDSARTGNSIFVRMININYTVAYNTAATGVGQCVRGWLILDTQQASDETTVSFTDIFNNQNVNSQLNPDTVGRYKILKKVTHYVSADKPKVQFNIIKKMRHHVRYNGPASTDLQKGAIFWVVCSDQATNAPTVTYSNRISYHDN